MGNPICRMEDDFNRQGIKLSRQTMSNWMLKATELYLNPLYDLMKKQLLANDVIHADETTLQVLHEEGRLPSQISYMWLYRTGRYADRQIVIGRKNFLFANTPRGAQGSAVMYSIVETAKENGLDPYKYLKYIFEKGQQLDMGNEEDLKTLLPGNVPETCKVAAKF